VADGLIAKLFTRRVPAASDACKQRLLVQQLASAFGVAS